MLTWWNALSVETLSQIYNWARWGIALFGFFTAIAGAITIFASNRITFLQAERFRDMEEKATSAQRELGVMRERYSQRTITDDQKMVMVGILSRQQAGILHLLTAAAGNAEALAYMKDMEKVFREARWGIQNIAANFQGWDAPMGVIIMVQSQVNTPADVALIREALNAVHIPFNVQVHDYMPHGSISILVGHKPN